VSHRETIKNEECKKRKRGRRHSKVEWERDLTAMGRKWRSLQPSGTAQRKWKWGGVDRPERLRLFILS